MSPSRLAVVLLIAAQGCGEPPDPVRDEPPEPGGVVARVAGEAIRVEDLVGVGPLATEAERRRAVDAAILRRLAAEDARRRGLADSSEASAEIAAIRGAARAREEAFLRDASYRQLRDALEPTEAELLEHYEQTKTRYLERQWVFRRRDFASRGEAEAADAALGPDGRLDPGAETIGPAPIPRLPRELLPEALRLESPGSRTLVETESGWVLLELVEIRPAAEPPFQDVADRVEKSWRTLRGQEAFAAHIAAQRQETEISIHEEALLDDSIWEDRSR